MYVHTFQLQPDFLTVRTPTKQKEREKEKEKEKEKEREKERWHRSNLKNEKTKEARDKRVKNNRVKATGRREKIERTEKIALKIRTEKI